MSTSYRRDRATYLVPKDDPHGGQAALGLLAEHEVVRAEAKAHRRLRSGEPLEGVQFCAEIDASTNTHRTDEDHVRLRGELDFRVPESDYIPSSLLGLPHFQQLERQRT